jgi:hypothetical protein
MNRKIEDDGKKNDNKVDDLSSKTIEDPINENDLHSLFAECAFGTRTEQDAPKTSKELAEAAAERLELDSVPEALRPLAAQFKAAPSPELRAELDVALTQNDMKGRLVKSGFEARLDFDYLSQAFVETSIAIKNKTIDPIAGLKKIDLLLDSGLVWYRLEELSNPDSQLLQIKHLTRELICLQDADPYRVEYETDYQKLENLIIQTFTKFCESNTLKVEPKE